MNRYMHIENHYKEAFITKFMHKYGKELRKCTYVIQEKIHGMNFRLIWTGKEFKYGTRNTIRQPDQIKYLEYLMPQFDELKAKMMEFESEVILFGEIYGQKIQKEIKYGDEPGVKFFDVMIDGELQTQKYFYDFVPEEYRVPTFKFTNTLKKALNYKVERLHSKIEPTVFIEGVVIKPYDRIFRIGHSVFYIKKKRKEFLERTAGPQSRYRDTFKRMSDFHSPLLDYITDGRIASVIAREGGIGSKKEISKFIKLILKDAVKDYDRKYIATTVDRKVCGAVIAKKLLARLENES